MEKHFLKKNKRQEDYEAQTKGTLIDYEVNDEPHININCLLHRHRVRRKGFRYDDLLE
ncbi:MAG: hypothetical protein R2769_02850 [Saprospiraceae bacterium]